jgi:dTDP-glucose 4,6-dehydratase
MKESVAIIGIHSFSGSSLAGLLMEKGYSIIGFARSEGVADSFLPFKNLKLSSEQQVRIFQTNILSDYNYIADIIHENETEYVVNFAAQSMVAESWIYPEDWYDVNVSAMAKLIGAIMQRNGNSIKKFIQFTTPEVYGSTSGIIKENWNFSPTTPYAISRAASDFHLRALAQTYGFPVVFTRTANVYGPYQKLYRLVPKVVVKAMRGERFELHGGGESIRSFIHAKDVSNALFKILHFGNIGETYHISTNDFISILQLVKLVLSKLDKDFEEYVTIVGDRPGKDNAYLLDSEKIRNELNWFDRVTLSTGVDEVIDWVNQNWAEFQNLDIDYKHIR